MPRNLSWLWCIVTFLTLVAPAAAFNTGTPGNDDYIPPGNIPLTQPPNYNLIGEEHFVGQPSFGGFALAYNGGYHVFYDPQEERWNVASVVFAGGSVFEQLHGSVLVQLEGEPAAGVNVWPLGFEYSDDLHKNDRWGWVKWSDEIGSNIYEIWWDITIDYPRLENEEDFCDTIGISFSGCAFDFNIWATGHFAIFSAEQVIVGSKMVPITEIPEFTDTYSGLFDPYQDGVSQRDPNTSSFSLKDFPGAAYNKYGLIFEAGDYYDSYGGSRAYEGNGVQFSVNACPPENSPPYYNPPLGYTKDFNICPGSTIYDTIVAFDPDPGDILSLHILSGPGTLNTEPGTGLIKGFYSWTPVDAGVYKVVFETSDNQGHIVVDTATYTVLFNNKPELSAFDSSATVCSETDFICYTVVAEDIENDLITFRKLQGPGTIDPQTGEVCFKPYNEGDFYFVVEGADICGADTATFTISVDFNDDPYLNAYDSVVYLCGTEEICFDVIAEDPNPNDSLEIKLLSGHGQFSQTGNGVGFHCFMPEAVDSARYVFHYSVTDECWRNLIKNPMCPMPPEDSIIIIVLTDTPAEITCPEGIQYYNLCSAQEICLPIAINPPDAQVTILEGGATYANGEICFYAGQTGVYTFTLVASGDCGDDTCVVTFDVTIGMPPEITCPEGIQYYNLCSAQEICLPIAINPPDAQVTILEGGAAYSDGEFCFYAGQTGVYTFTLVASGDCGDDTCAVTFDVTIGMPPEITCPEGIQYYNLCSAQEICLPIAINPPDAQVTILEGGATYSNGELCFYADQTGVYTFTVVASGDCGDDTCVVSFDVTIGTPVSIACPDGVINIDLCQPGKVCHTIVYSPADAEVRVIEGGATIIDGELCFLADVPGIYNFTFEVENECGADTCKITFDVKLNSDPFINPYDSIVYLCNVEEICFPVTASDPDLEDSLEIKHVGGPGIFTQTQNGEGIHCFMPAAVDSARYVFHYTVTDECWRERTKDPECPPLPRDSIIIIVITDTPPEITCPEGIQYYNLCSAQEICLPIAINPPDAQVTILEGGATYSDGELCFYADQTGVYTFTVVASGDCGDDTCVVTFDVTIGIPPEITCPEGIQYYNLCSAQEICLPIAINPPDAQVTILEGGATYANGEICFYADQTGVYTFTIVASGDCGDDTCAVTFDITIGTPPEITCPEGIQYYNLCSAQEICLPIAINPPDAQVTILEGGATYSDGELCFYADQTGVYTFTVVASGDCGDDTCVVTFDVTIGTPPEITCPEGIQYYNLCSAQEICLPIAINPPDAQVTILEGGATYSNGEICFYADQTGVYTFTVVASGDCGDDTCVVTFDITIGTPPEITCPEGIQYYNLCSAQEICLPIAINPPDAQVTILEGGATYSNGELCFYADQTGVYTFTIVASGDCGDDTCVVTFDITIGTPPEITCPEGIQYYNLCSAQEICLPIAINPPDAQVTILEGGATYANGEICFYADQTGVYTFTVVASGDCGDDTCVVTFDVTIGTPPEITCPEGIQYYNLCSAQEICLPIAINPPDAQVTILEGGATYANGEICFYADQTGVYTFTVVASGDCGDDTCVVTFDITIGTPPEITCPEGIQYYNLCSAQEICLPIAINPPDAQVTILEGGATYANGEICFYADQTGVYTFTVVASGDCGDDTCVVTFDVTIGIPPDPNCPDDTSIIVCNPGQVCLDVGSLGTNVTVRPEQFNYDPQQGTLCYLAQENSVDTVTVIDSTACGIDSCQFIITTGINQPPEIIYELPEENKYCEPFTYCLDLLVVDPDDNLDDVFVDGNCTNFTYDRETGQLCIDVETDVNCTLTVVATDLCNVSRTVKIPFSFERNIPPVIDFPELEVIVRCESDTSTIFVSEVCVSDPDYDDVTMTLDSGNGEFSFDPILNCGILSFKPPVGKQDTYCFKFKAADYCDTVYETLCIDVELTPVCTTCVDIYIEGPGCVNSGSVPTVNIVAETENQIGGYDLLIAYDASVITFARADIGDAINAWEFFTYRYGAYGNCSGDGCPSGLLRLTAIADINNGPSHPPEEQYDPDGSIASMTFRVSGNINYGGRNIPIQFFWYDCNDNAFSDKSGQYLFIDQIIYDPRGRVIWDEANDTEYPESARFDWTGAPDECLSGDKYTPIRCIDFHNGELCIIHPDSIDDRGDMNLNGIKYEIADAVVYTNYFVYGLSAFNISIPGQIAASDVNADGTTLSIADLIYLIRVIAGDALPYPKPTIENNTIQVRCGVAKGDVLVAAESPVDLGGIFLSFEYSGERPGNPGLAGGASEMDIKYAFTADNRLRVLVYSLESGRKINAGGNELIRIEAGGNTEIRLVQVDAGDYYGRMLDAQITNSAMPTKLLLTQNRPNPFNPSTTFQMALPVASDYTVSIFNITGQTIKTWTGYSEAGTVTFDWDGTDNNGQRIASGIYLYRAQAAGESAIKKMVFIK